MHELIKAWVGKCTHYQLLLCTPYKCVTVRTAYKVKQSTLKRSTLPLVLTNLASKSCV